MSNNTPFTARVKRLVKRPPWYNPVLKEAHKLTLMLALWLAVISFILFIPAALVTSAVIKYLLVLLSKFFMWSAIYFLGSAHGVRSADEILQEQANKESELCRSRQ